MLSSGLHLVSFENLPMLMLFPLSFRARCIVGAITWAASNIKGVDRALVPHRRSFIRVGLMWFKCARPGQRGFSAGSGQSLEISMRSWINCHVVGVRERMAVERK